MTLELTRLEESIKKLPPLPAAVTEVMEILNREEVHFALLDERIGNDPILAARVLTVANSPFYGFGGKIDSIKQACMILGFHTTRNIVMAVGVMSKFDAEQFLRLDLKALWQHSLGTGISAKVLSRHVGVDPEQAFVSGLLHDIGKMVLNMFYSEDYSAVLDYRDEHNCLLLEAENSILGFNHAIVGSLMAHHWKIPDEIINAIKYHHTPEDEQAMPVARLLHVADIVCRKLEIGNGGDAQIPVLHTGVMEKIGLDDKLIEQSSIEIKELIVASAALIE